MIWASLMIFLASISAVIWGCLTFFYHGFWRRREFLPPANSAAGPLPLPSVLSLTPARDEEAVIEASLRSILKQNYNGEFHSLLIDDNSGDATHNIATKTVEALRKTQTARIITAPPLEAGWSGKLWALHNGFKAAQVPTQGTSFPDYYWLSDADITHAPETLSRLMAHARKNDLAMVSLMVTLNCTSFWEKLIIPAFLYYFQLLYPFAATANPSSKIAGGAGGCILLRRDALEAIGGIESLKQTLIDDCALAAAVKRKGYRIWLGHGLESRSIRSSAKLKDLWNMVSRTAFTQLNFSYLQLFGAIFGMFLIYTVPVIAVAAGIVLGQLALGGIGAISWILMAITYAPTVRSYGRQGAASFLLPFTAQLFMVMTLHSAWLHFRGTHSGWRGRIYGHDNSRNAQ